MRFLVDAQLPIALARLLEQHGYESKHVAYSYDHEPPFLSS